MEQTIGILEKQSTLLSEGRSNSIYRWFHKYRWHFVFWIGYFCYTYSTDKILLGDYMTLTKEIILITSHHLFLFYSYLICYEKFSSKSFPSLVISIFRFIIVIAIFFGIRMLLNFKLFPFLDQANGIDFPKLNLHQLAIKTFIWVTEFLAKSAAYFFFFKLNAEQKRSLIESNKKERILAEKKIEEERAKQIELNYTRLENVFTNLIHETKTPLTLLINWLAGLEKKIGTSEELNLIKGSVNKLSKDISNIFDIERIKKGKEFFDHNQTCNISDVVLDNISMFEYYSANRKMNIRKEIDPNISVKADPSAINRIVNNLVENAIKYSNVGSPIFVSLTKKGNNVIFSVHDEGLGIPEEDMKHIFTPYHQLNKNKRNVQGMGLGLPMVKSIVDGIGGDILIQNNGLNLRGVTAVVSLPISTSEVNVQHFPVPQKENYNFEEILLSDIIIDESLPNILVVEDHRALNNNILKNLGQKFNVSFALNGKEALEKIKNKIPDLIISDVMMDVMDGLEMAKAIVGNPDHSHIPIIFLSAKSSLADKIHGLSLGAVDYIEKPFAIDELLKKVESFLINKEKGHRILFNYTFEKLKRESQLFTETDHVNANKFDENCDFFQLTPREKEIAKYVIEGLTTKTIAEKISRAENTVKNHVSSIYEKVGVNSKYDLIKKLEA